MSDSFNVFDEWGNYVGKFTPAGGFDNLLVGMFFLGLLLIGYLFYLVYKLVISGFKHLKNGDYMRGFLYLTLPTLWLIAVLCALMYPTFITSVERDPNSLCNSIKVREDANGITVYSRSYSKYFVAEMSLNGVNTEVMMNFGQGGATIPKTQQVVLLRVYSDSIPSNRRFDHDCNARVLYPN